MEYSHYLKQVVDVLETDPDFREKLGKAEPEHIMVGYIYIYKYLYWECFT